MDGLETILVGEDLGTPIQPIPESDGTFPLPSTTWDYLLCFPDQTQSEQTMSLTPIPIHNLIALSLVSGAGRKVVHTAIQIARRRQIALEHLFGQDRAELLALAGPGEQAVAEPLSRVGAAEQERALFLLQLADEWGIQHWTCEATAYPSFLSRCLGTQAPPFLFYQGNESLIAEPGAGIVGTRRPSLEGKDWARKAAGLFAEEGVTVVSGGAAGIDLEAHGAALRADGTTVVWLPEGLHAYQAPPVLRTGVENGQALLVSEFLPTAAWATPQAITRNRSIAACACLACVIEPGKKGGSMYTAEQTLAQDKPVFYWGGSCRDGFLKHERAAHPLGGRYGDLHREELLAALVPPEAAPSQGDLFGG